MASLRQEDPVDGRLAELKAFDETKTGVKGLVDAGVTSIPTIFISRPEHLPADTQAAAAATRHQQRLQVPIIDISGITEGADSRRDVVEQVRRASESWGFFQLVGHGVPARVLDEMVAGIRRFHEAEAAHGGEDRSAFYSRDPARKVKYYSNFDLYQARTANWRDTLFCRMAPDSPGPEEIPAICREIIVEYSDQVRRVGSTLLELLSEALGLRRSHLGDMECDEGHVLLCHYYPPCPQPELTLGVSRHSDSGFLSVLLQDDVGGLQVLHRQQWVDVPPLNGALVVNLGDLMQLITNDRFKSVEHRVLSSRRGPRVSVACFFTTHVMGTSTRLYGPIEELLGEGDPPRYRPTLVSDYTKHYNAKGLTGESALLDYRLVK